MHHEYDTRVPRSRLPREGERESPRRSARRHLQKRTHRRHHPPSTPPVRPTLAALVVAPHSLRDFTPSLFNPFLLSPSDVSIRPIPITANVLEVTNTSAPVCRVRARRGMHESSRARGGGKHGDTDGGGAAKEEKEEVSGASEPSLPRARGDERSRPYFDVTRRTKIERKKRAAANVRRV